MSARTSLAKSLSAFALALIFTMGSAYADTDYRCLSECIRGGKTESICMPQCTNISEGGRTAQSSSFGALTAPVTVEGDTPGVSISEPTKSIPNLADNHRIFSSLNPIGTDDIISSKKPTSPFVVTKDYRCVHQCLSTQLQYDSCQKICTNVALKNGNVVRKVPPMLYAQSPVVTTDRKPRAGF